MGVAHNNSYAGLRFEPEVSHTFLPRCTNCSSPHPLAIKTAVDKTACPNCGMPAGRPGETVTQVGVMSSPVIWIGQKLLAIGRFFANLSRKVDP